MKKTFPLIIGIAICFLAGPSAFALSPSSFDFGGQLSHITYKEPGLMRQSGIMYGVTAAYTRIGRNIMWKVDGTLTTGEVEYVGSYADGTPVTADGIRDTMFETRAVLGPTEFVFLSSHYLPYMGVGYRYLYDGANSMPGGYRRESNYLYIPLGVEGVPFARGDWSFGFSVEYDLFVKGHQVSYLRDADPVYGTIENDQTTGYGFRASLKFIRAGKRNIMIEPFYRYWQIKESSVDSLNNFVPVPLSFVEPDNNSTELGIRVLLRF